MGCSRQSNIAVSESAPQNAHGETRRQLELWSASGAGSWSGASVTLGRRAYLRDALLRRPSGRSKYWLFAVLMDLKKPRWTQR